MVWPPRKSEKQAPKHQSTKHQAPSRVSWPENASVGQKTTGTPARVLGPIPTPPLYWGQTSPWYPWFRAARPLYIRTCEILVKFDQFLLILGIFAPVGPIGTLSVAESARRAARFLAFKYSPYCFRILGVGRQSTSIARRPRPIQCNHRVV